MDHNELEQLIYRILATENEEIDCDQVFELIARYVDLEVAGEEATQLLPLVYKHLVQCDRCSDLHNTLYDLAMLEEQDALPDVDDLLDDILTDNPAHMIGPASGSPGVSQASPPRRNSAAPPVLPEDTAFHTPTGSYRTAFIPTQLSSRFRWGWAAAAVALIMAVAFGAWGWYESSQIAQLRSDVMFITHADRAIWLQGTAQDPDARGYLFVNEAQGRALLTIVGLNPAPLDQVYQMWIMTGSGTSSAGTFAVRSGHWGRFYIDLAPQGTQFTSLAITLEPKGGSSTPTTSPVCVWGKQM
jgi:hypothetical protein